MDKKHTVHQIEWNRKGIPMTDNNQNNLCTEKRKNAKISKGKKHITYEDRSIRRTFNFSMKTPKVRKAWINVQ